MVSDEHSKLDRQTKDNHRLTNLFLSLESINQLERLFVDVYWSIRCLWSSGYDNFATNDQSGEVISLSGYPRKKIDAKTAANPGFSRATAISHGRIAVAHK